MAEVDKNKLRTVYLRKRKFLSQSAFQSKNLKVQKQFNAFFEKMNVQNIHVFLPIEKQYEVNTWPLIEIIKNANKNVIISKSDLTSNHMDHFIYEEINQLKNNKWGIPEPTKGQKVNANQIDMVLVPLIVFDKNGHRIGYGKGYYDRFLEQCKKDCIKVGLSLAPPLDDIPYMETFDIPLDYCITPLSVYQFNKNSC